MDHLDGFDALADEFLIQNFWDSVVRRDKPSFDGTRYREEDWDRYVNYRDGAEPAVTVVHPRAGSSFQFANKNEANVPGGDGLSVLAPTKELVSAANNADVCNDASYVILYRSAGGRILIPGDAHDETWNHVVKNYSRDIANASVLFAPHHGRRSGCDFSFLDTMRPKLTLFGCASSGDLAYEEWRSRGLPVITNNQAGNVVLEIDPGTIDVFVENEEFAAALNVNTAIRNSQGYVYLGAVTQTNELELAAGAY
jgi:competence protein ComEC